MDQKDTGQAEKSMKNWYDKYYKILAIIPLLLILASVVFLWNFNSQHGDVILKDVSLTGGTVISVFDSDLSIEQIKSELSTEFPDLVVRGISDFRTGGQIGILIETQADASEIRPALERVVGYALTNENSSIEFSGAALSQSFNQQLRKAVLIAFIFMALVVLIIFRTFIPSLAVVLAAFGDIAMTIVFIDLFGIKLSIAGVIAFLMLIGYSVDTDILLTTRLLKNKEGSVNQRIFSAFKTGITMTLTSIAAVGVALIIIYNFSDTLRQIFLVLSIGLGFDLINTWFMNAGILKWYTERKEKELGYKGVLR